MTTEAITTTQRELKMMLGAESVQERLKSCLGTRSQQFATSILSLTNATPQLQKCKPATILASAMTAATLDLPVNKDLGFAWIVPYGQEAQFQLGYKGFIQLAMRTGQYAGMNAVIVNAEMLDGYNSLGEPVIKWENQDADAEIIGYWFGFELVNGFKKSLYWSKAKVEKHANRFSQAFKNGRTSPWQTDFDSMALKTVTKACLSHWGILSIEMQKAIAADQAVIPEVDAEPVYVDNGGITQDTIDTAVQNLEAKLAE